MPPLSLDGLAALGGAAADVGGPAPGGGDDGGGDLGSGGGDGEAPEGDGHEPPDAPLPPYLLDLLKVAAEAGAAALAAAPVGEEEEEDGGVAEDEHTAWEKCFVADFKHREAQRAYTELEMKRLLGHPGVRTTLWLRSLSEDIVKLGGKSGYHDAIRNALIALAEESGGVISKQQLLSSLQSDGTGTLVDRLLRLDGCGQIKEVSLRGLPGRPNALLAMPPTDYLLASVLKDARLAGSFCPVQKLPPDSGVVCGPTVTCDAAQKLDARFKQRWLRNPLRTVLEAEFPDAAVVQETVVLDFGNDGAAVGLGRNTEYNLCTATVGNIHHSLNGTLANISAVGIYKTLKVGDPATDAMRVVVNDVNQLMDSAVLRELLYTGGDRKPLLIWGRDTNGVLTSADANGRPFLYKVDIGLVKENLDKGQGQKRACTSKCEVCRGMHPYATRDEIVNDGAEGSGSGVAEDGAEEEGGAIGAGGGAAAAGRKRGRGEGVAGDGGGAGGGAAAEDEAGGAEAAAFEALEAQEERAAEPLARIAPPAATKKALSPSAAMRAQLPHDWEELYALYTIYSNAGDVLQSSVAPPPMRALATKAWNKTRALLESMGFDPNHPRPAWFLIPEIEEDNFSFSLYGTKLPTMRGFDVLHTFWEGTMKNFERLCHTAARRSRGLDDRAAVHALGNAADRALSLLASRVRAFDNGHLYYPSRSTGLNAPDGALSGSEKKATVGICVSALCNHITPDDALRRAVILQGELNMVLNGVIDGAYYTPAMARRVEELGRDINRSLEPFRKLRYRSILAEIDAVTYKQHLLAHHLGFFMDKFGVLKNGTTAHTEALNHTFKAWYESTPRKGRVATYMVRQMLHESFVRRRLPALRLAAAVPRAGVAALPPPLPLAAKVIGVHDNEFLRLRKTDVPVDPRQVPHLVAAYNNLRLSMPQLPIDLPATVEVFGGVSVVRTVPHPVRLLVHSPLAPPKHAAHHPSGLDMTVAQRCTVTTDSLLLLRETALAPATLRAPPLSAEDLHAGRVNVSDDTDAAPVGVLVAAFHLASADMEAVARAEDAAHGARVGVGDGLRKARAGAAAAAAAAGEDGIDDAEPAGPHPCDGYRGDGGRYAALGFALVQLCEPFAARSNRDGDFSFHRARALSPRCVLVPIAHIWGKVRWFHHYDEPLLPLYRGKAPLPLEPPKAVPDKFLFSLAIDDPFLVWRPTPGARAEEEE